MDGRKKQNERLEACIRTWEMREKKTNYKSNSKGMSKLDAQINEWQEAKKLL